MLEKMPNQEVTRGFALDITTTDGKVNLGIPAENRCARRQGSC